MPAFTERESVMYNQTAIQFTSHVLLFERRIRKVNHCVFWTLVVLGGSVCLASSIPHRTSKQVDKEKERTFLTPPLATTETMTIWSLGIPTAQVQCKQGLGAARVLNKIGSANMALLTKILGAVEHTVCFVVQFPSAHIHDFTLGAKLISEQLKASFSPSARWTSTAIACDQHDFSRRSACSCPCTTAANSCVFNLCASMKQNADFSCLFCTPFSCRGGSILSTVFCFLCFFCSCTTRVLAARLTQHGSFLQLYPVLGREAAGGSWPLRQQGDHVVQPWSRLLAGAQPRRPSGPEGSARYGLLLRSVHTFSSFTRHQYNYAHSLRSLVISTRVYSLTSW